MKKIILFVICITLTFASLRTVASEVSAQCLPDSMVQHAVNGACRLGIMDCGLCNDWSEAITRKVFAQCAYNLIYVLPTELDISTSKTSSPFYDVDIPAVTVLEELGIIKGKTAKKFAPDEFITREEAAVMLGRIVDFIGDKIKPVNQPVQPYVDESYISPWAIEWVKKVSAVGIMNGVGDGIFAPGETYSFEQTAITLMRIYDSVPVSCEATYTDKINELMPDDKNYVFSPFSIKTVFALAANGANGETRDEILNTFDIDSLEEFNDKCKLLTEQYKGNDDGGLIISNSLWINRDYTDSNFSDEYRSLASEYYSACSDVVTNSDAVNKINSWVRQNTDGKIKSVIESPDFFSALANAIYFKSNWLNPFDESMTSKSEFTDRSGNINEIDFMNQTGYFKLYESEDIRIIQIPFENIRRNVAGSDKSDIYATLPVSIYIILSDKENVCVDSMLNDVLNTGKFSVEYVDLSIPEFKIEYSGEISKILSDIGIKRVFSEDADFENMFDNGSQSFDKCLHKTYIGIDEYGAEAAAVTMTLTKPTSNGNDFEIPEPLEFKANRPFTFVIRDDMYNENLFVGEYAFCE